MIEAGSKIGNYKLTRLLGEGGMGRVFEGIHEQIGRRAAIKVLHAQFAHNSEAYTRFLNEARAVNIIQHPGLVNVFEFGQTEDGSPYIVMEFLEGQTLADRLAAVGRMSMGALRIARQIASALMAAHAKHIVHRDLKPANVMLVPDPDMPGGERVKVVDFGIAKISIEHNDTGYKTRAGAILGTPTYMSPEQCRGAGEVTDKTDVYALGVMIYEMLVGRPPFVAEGGGEIMGMHLFQAPPALHMLEPTLPLDLVDLVHSMLSKDPDARPSIVQVAQELDRIGGRLSGPMQAVSADIPVEPKPPGPLTIPIDLRRQAQVTAVSHAPVTPMPQPAAPSSGTPPLPSAPHLVMPAVAPSLITPSPLGSPYVTPYTPYITPVHHTPSYVTPSPYALPVPPSGLTPPPPVAPSAGTPPLPSPPPHAPVPHAPAPVASSAGTPPLPAPPLHAPVPHAPVPHAPPPVAPSAGTPVSGLPPAMSASQSTPVLAAVPSMPPAPSSRVTPALGSLSPATTQILSSGTTPVIRHPVQAEPAAPEAAPPAAQASGSEAARDSARTPSPPQPSRVTPGSAQPHEPTLAPSLTGPSEPSPGVASRADSIPAQVEAASPDTETLVSAETSEARAPVDTAGFASAPASPARLPDSPDAVPVTAAVGTSESGPIKASPVAATIGVSQGAAVPAAEASASAPSAPAVVPGAVPVVVPGASAGPVAATPGSAAPHTTPVPAGPTAQSSPAVSGGEGPAVLSPLSTAVVATHAAPRPPEPPETEDKRALKIVLLGLAAAAVILAAGLGIGLSLRARGPQGAAADRADAAAVGASPSIPTGPAVNAGSSPSTGPGAVPATGPGPATAPSAPPEDLGSKPAPPDLSSPAVAPGPSLSPDGGVGEGDGKAKKKKPLLRRKKGLRNEEIEYLD